MSYDISLNDPVTREVVQFDTPHQMKGGTYCIGGTTEASLNITYNYCRWYYGYDKFGIDGIRSIEGMSGADSIHVIERTIKSLEESEKNLSDDERTKLEEQGVTGYWLPTKENALKPLYQLLAMAKMRPYAVWEIE